MAVSAAVEKEREAEPAALLSERRGSVSLEKGSSLIRVKGLSKKFKKKLVLSDVNFEICAGDMFGVIGMSGSGKTTLFQLLSGIITPTAGDVLVQSRLFNTKNKKSNDLDYVSVFKNFRKVKETFGFTSQIPSFYEHLTVEENLFMYGALYGLPKRIVRENSKKLLRLVELSDEKDTLAEELSGGMQRRLDIACALLHSPNVLLLDEPTSDLDPVMRAQIWELLKEINSRGTTVIIASHILGEIEQLCNKVAILHDKRVLGYGTLKELKRMFLRNKEILLEFESKDYSKIKSALKKEKKIERIVETDGRMRIYAQNEDELIRKIIKTASSGKDRIVCLDVSDATLSEIFETLSKKLTSKVKVKE
jgi:ABC-2 type transport system ATP-binding protein